MPLGIVNNDDFNSELDNCHPDRTIKPEIIDINKGRGNGNVAVPEILQKVIGETANVDGRANALAIAKQFGISDSSVSAYTAGATSTATIDTPKPELVKSLNTVKERITKRALGTMRRAMLHITEDKLADAKVSDLATVARNMSAIVKDMEPSADNNGEKIVPQFIVYKPQIINENNFERIQVRE